MELQIEQLTKTNIPMKIGDILRLETNWMEIGEPAWEEGKFYLDLPGKWELSLLVYTNQELVGYAIASGNNSVAKLNKIVVNRNLRRQGIATRLWEELLTGCRKKGFKRLEFKVLKDNLAAIEFYKNHDCVFYGESLGDDKITRYNVRYVFSADKIGHSKPTLNDDDALACYDSVKSGNLAAGEIVDRFVTALKSRVGKKFGAATTSGTSALHISLRALNIGEGDEVIIPSYVCGSVLNAVNYCRASPVIADINRDYNLSLEDVKKRMTCKTKAIILPHMFGKPSSETEGFMELGVPIIEDCALSVGAEHNGRAVGSFGNITIFSFYATKVLTTGCGGMVLTDDKTLIERINDLLEYDNRLEFGECYNYKMSDIQASLGLIQLSKLDGFIERRREIARAYTSLLEKCREISVPDNEENIFFRYIIRCSDTERLIANLRKRGVDASRPVFTPLHKYLGLNDGDFPNTTRAYEEAVSIPIYPSLTESEIYDVAGAIMNSETEDGGLI